MTPPLTRIGGSWRRLWRSSPTRAIRSFTTPVRIWLPTVGPRVWFRRSCLSIACRIIFFLRGWSYWMVSSLPRPPTRGRCLWQRTSHLPLRQPLWLICFSDSGLLRWRPFPLWGVPRVSLGGVPCAPPPPIILLSRGLDLGASPPLSGLLGRQPFLIWGGGSCVPGKSARRAPAPHDAPFTGPCRPDPDGDISAGLLLPHQARPVTLHPPFFNGGRFGSPASSSPGTSSVPSFWHHHRGASFSSSPSPRHHGGSSTPSSLSPRHHGGSSFSSSSIGVMRAKAGSSHQPPVLEGSASLAIPPSIPCEVQVASSSGSDSPDKCQGTATDGFFSS